MSPVVGLRLPVTFPRRFCGAHRRRNVECGMGSPNRYHGRSRGDRGPWLADVHRRIVRYSFGPGGLAVKACAANW